MSEPVCKKSSGEEWIFFFDKTCNPSCAEPFQEGFGEGLEGPLSGHRQDDAFGYEWASSKLVEAITRKRQPLLTSQSSHAPFCSKALTDFHTLRFHPKTPEPLIGWMSEGGLAGISSLQEYCGLKKKDEGNLPWAGLKSCVDGTIVIPPDHRSQEEIAAAREIFIQNLAVNIVDPKAMDRFMAIMQGLLSNEPDEAKWKEIYDHFFAWSEEDLAEVDDYTFTYEETLAQNLAGDTKVAEILSGDPKVSGYVAGLILRAEYLYAEQDPEFVTEYNEYLELTLSKLAAEDKLNPGSLEDQVRTPESYRKQGFLNLPERPENALTGSEFMENVLGVDLGEYKKNPRQLGKLSKVERENAILKQIELGNVPEFLRRPKAVIIKGSDGEEVKTYVMPDYIAIGSNEDFVRVPLPPLIAQALARKYDLALPTKTIVEETYLQAGKRVVGPSYSRPDEFELNSAYLDSPGFYLRSNEDIDAQLMGVKPGTLVSGGKKELVVSPFVAVRVRGVKADESIGFYGLYDTQGVPIQRSPGHGGEGGYRHTEYALGVRFMSPMIVVRDGSGKRKVMTMSEGLQDGAVAKIISRLERTDEFPNFRSPLMDGPFDPNTCYQQKMPKGQKEPQGPGV